MTRTELMLAAAVLLYACVCLAGECSERGTGTLTRVFGLHSEVSTLYLHKQCHDGSWRKESIFIGNPDAKDDNYPDSMLLRFAWWQNARKGE